MNRREQMRFASMNRSQFIARANALPQHEVLRERAAALRTENAKRVCRAGQFGSHTVGAAAYSWRRR